MKIVKLRRGFTEIQRIFELIQGNGFIAGGYARYCASPKRKPIEAKDIDIFPLHKENDFDSLKKVFLEQKFEMRHENDVSFTFKKSPEGWEEVPNIQLIKPNDMAKMLTYGTQEEVLNNFDFTITRAAILSPTEVLVDDDFERDENALHLVLKNIHCPVSSLLRCCKYSRKGYYLKPLEAIKLFDDWQNRDNAYRQKIMNFVLESGKYDPEHPETSNLTKEDVEELEKMMMLD